AKVLFAENDPKAVSRPRALRRIARMPRSARRFVFVLVIAAIALLARWPLFRAGWLGDDLPLLGAAAQAAAAPASAAERAGWLEGGLVRPIHGQLLVVHARIFGEQGAFAPEHARALRSLSFAAWLAAAAALGFALSRALAPWIDAQAAEAAGFAA